MIELIIENCLSKLKLCIDAILFVAKHITLMIESPVLIVLIILLIATLILFAKSVIAAIISKIKFL